jgi:glycosyltransferase involved in cell wall biosynthesis
MLSVIMPTNKRAERILLLVTQADWGGVQSFLLRFAEALVADRRTVLLAAGGEGELWERAQRAGIPTHRLTHTVREINPWEDWRAVGEITKLIDDFKPNAIHLNSSKMGVIGSIAASRSKTKPWTVYRIGGWSFLEPMASWKQWIYRNAEKWSARFKDVIITVHPGDEALATSLNIIPRHQLTTVPNGLDVASFVTKLKTRTEAKQALSVPEHAFVFATIAGMYPTKALLPYLDVLARVLREDKHAYGVIIGDGPEEPAIRAKHATLDVKDRILLTGYLDGTVLFSAFDTFVLPSRKEGMPWTLLEAMAAGVPVVATDVGACRWMLTDERLGNAGRVVPPNDPQSLFDALNEVRTNPEIRNAYSRSGHAISLQRFSWNETLRGNLGALDHISR